MDVTTERESDRARHLIEMTRNWGAWKAVSLYLDRCQVDTPDGVVSATWKHVRDLRPQVGKVIDFGAGDARFARVGQYTEYVGYEIDRNRSRGAKLPAAANLIHRCAFSDDIGDADVCIGNPPFVRNQDLPEGWRQHASSVLQRRTGVTVSGLANAWQYFFLLSLASAKPDGLVALVVPYEWVSRPSAKALRDYVNANRWNVSVYRLVDTTFDRVMTTSSITIIDKRKRDATWSYFEEKADGTFKALRSPSGSASGVIQYLPRSEVGKLRAVRGLSPGTQKVLVLTEGERVHFGLMKRRDVVPCVTTLRHLPTGVKTLTAASFKTRYVMAGEKCWLIRTDRKASHALASYLSGVPKAAYQTSTCLERSDWWKFNMPPIPDLIMSMSFKSAFPKAVRNAIRARAVGGVCGIYGSTRAQASQIVGGLDGLDIRNRIVAHSNGLRKIEVNQLNALLAEAFKDKNDR